MIKFSLVQCFKQLFNDCGSGWHSNNELDFFAIIFKFGKSTWLLLGSLRFLDFFQWSLYSIMWKPGFTVQYVQLTVSKVHINIYIKKQINHNNNFFPNMPHKASVLHYNNFLFFVCVCVCVGSSENFAQCAHGAHADALISIFQDGSIHQHEWCEQSIPCNIHHIIHTG